MPDKNIVIKGAREHNLKNVDLTIPRDKFIVFTGLSGSGKTYYCRDFVKRHPEYVYMNIDDFYTTYNGEPVHKNEFSLLFSFL